MNIEFPIEFDRLISPIVAILKHLPRGNEFSIGTRKQLVVRLGEGEGGIPPSCTVGTMAHKPMFRGIARVTFENGVVVDFPFEGRGRYEENEWKLRMNHPGGSVEIIEVEILEKPIGLSDADIDEINRRCAEKSRLNTKEPSE